MVIIKDELDVELPVAATLCVWSPGGTAVWRGSLHAQGGVRNVSGFGASLIDI